MNRPRFRGRFKPGVMNRLEHAYADELEEQKRAGKIAWYAFEAIKFRLADKTFYTPDFIVMGPLGDIEAHEVKGFWQDDARVKIKVAAELFPLPFCAVTHRKKQWVYEWFNAALPEPDEGEPDDRDSRP